jgi:hypothetical protein
VPVHRIHGVMANRERPKRSKLVDALLIVFFFAIGFVGVVGGLSLLQGRPWHIPHQLRGALAHA